MRLVLVTYCPAHNGQPELELPDKLKTESSAPDSAPAAHAAAAAPASAPLISARHQEKALRDVVQLQAELDDLRIELKVA